MWVQLIGCIYTVHSGSAGLVLGRKVGIQYSLPLLKIPQYFSPKFLFCIIPFLILAGRKCQSPVGL